MLDIIKKLEPYVLIVGLILLSTVVSTKTMDQQTTIRFLIWSLLTAVLLLFHIAKGCPSVGLSGRLIIPAFIGYLLFAAFSLYGALNPIKGYYEIAKIFLMLLTLCLVVPIIRDNKDIIIKLITATALAMSLLCFHKFLYVTNIDTVYGRMGNPMGNRNPWAASQVLLLPFCIYAAIKYRQEWQFLGICTSTLIVVNLFIILNRTSVLALAVGATILGLSSRHARDYTIAALIIIITCCLCTPSFLDTDSMYARSQVWGQTLNLIAEAPWFGVGVNNWEIEIPRYAASIDIMGVFKRLFYQRPHNDYLWVLSETGVFGFTCYMLVFLLAIYYCIRSKNVLALIVLSAYMIIAFFSFPKERAYHSFIWVLALAFALVDMPVRERLAAKSIWLRSCLATVPLSLVIILFTIYFTSETHIKLLTGYSTTNQWDKVINEGKKISPYCTLDVYTIPVTWYMSGAYHQLGMQDHALRYARESLRYNLNNIYVLDRLGCLLDNIFEYDAALSCFTKALKIRPKYELVLKHKANTEAKKNYMIHLTANMLTKPVIN